MSRNIRIEIEAISGLPDVAEQYQRLIALQKDYTQTVERSASQITEAHKEEGKAVRGVSDELKKQQSDYDKHTAEVRKELDEQTAAVKKEASEQTGAVKAELDKQTAAVKKEAGDQTGAVKSELDKQTDLIKAESADRKAEIGKQTTAVKAELNEQTGAVKSEVGRQTDLIKAETADRKAELSKQTSAVKSELNDQTGAVKSELNKQTDLLKAESADRKAEVGKQTTAVKAELNEQTAAVKSEVSKQTDLIKAESADRKSEISKQTTAVKSELSEQTGAVKSEVSKQTDLIKAESADRKAEAGRQTDVVKAELDKQTAAVKAELDKQTDTVKTELNQQTAAYKTELNQQTSLVKGENSEQVTAIKGISDDLKAQRKQQTADLKTELGQQTINVKSELNEQTAAVKAEGVERKAEQDRQTAAYKAELNQQTAQFKTELNQQTAAQRAELNERNAVVKAELNQQTTIVKAEVAQQTVVIKAEQDRQTASLKAELDQQTAAYKAELAQQLAVVKEEERRKTLAVKAELDERGKDYEGFSGQIKNFASIVAAAFAFDQIKDFGMEVIDAKTKVDSMKIALDQLLGSKRVSNQIYQELVQVAKQTPFELGDVVDQTVKLAAYGIATQDLIPTITALGNMASVVGTEKLPQLTLAYGQIATTGKLMGDELNQFREAGIPLLDLLAESMKKPKEEILKLANAHQIAFEDIRAAVLKSSEAGGRYFSLMELQSKTLGGEVSNLGDTFFQLKARLGDFFEDGIRTGVRYLADFMDAIGGSEVAIKRTLTAISSAATALVSLRVATTAQASASAAWTVVQQAGTLAMGTYNLALITVKGTTEGFTDAQLASAAAARSTWAALAANPIGAVIAVVGLATSAYLAWKAATEDVTNAMGEQEFNLRKEQTELGNLIETTLRLGSSNRDRAGAIQLLINKYPDYFAGLRAEKTTNDDLRGILDKVNEAYGQRITLAQTAYKADQLSGKLRESFDEEAKLWERLKKVLSPEELKMMDDNLQNYFNLPKGRLMELNSSISSLWEGMLGRQVKEVVDSRKDMEKQLQDLDKERLTNTQKQNDALVAAENKRHEIVMAQLKAAHTSTAAEEQLHLDNLAKITGTYHKEATKANLDHDTNKKAQAKLTSAELQAILAQENADTMEAKLKALKEQEDVEIQAANKAAKNKADATARILAIEAEYAQKRKEIAAQANIDNTLNYDEQVQIAKSTTDVLLATDKKAAEERKKNAVESAESIKNAEQQIQNAQKETTQIIRETAEIQLQTKRNVIDGLVQMIGHGNQLAGALSAITIKAIQDVDLLTGKSEEAARSRLTYAQNELANLKMLFDQSNVEVQAKIAEGEKNVANAQKGLADVTAKSAEATMSVMNMAFQVTEMIAKAILDNVHATNDAIVQSIERTRDTYLELYDGLLEINKNALDRELKDFQGTFDEKLQLIQQYHDRDLELIESRDRIDALLTYHSTVADMTDKNGKILLSIDKEYKAKQQAALEQKLAKEQELEMKRIEWEIEQAQRLRDEKLNFLQEELDAFIEAKKAEQAALEANLDAQKAANDQFYSDRQLRLQADDQYRAELLAQGEAREVAALRAAMQREIDRATSADERTRIVNAFEQLIAEVHNKYQTAVGDKTKEVSLANTEAKAQEADRAKQLEADTAAKVKALKDEVAAKEAATMQQMKQAQADYTNFVNAATRQLWEAQKAMRIAELRAEIAILRGKRNLFNRGKIDSAIDDLNAAIGDIESISFDSGGVSAGGSGGSSGGGNTATPATPEQIKSEYDAKKAEQATAYQQIYNAGEEINALNDPNGSDMPRRQFLENFIQQQQQILSQLSQQLGQLEQKMRELGIPFKDGTDYVRGEGFPDGIDTVMARLTKGERVLTVDQNRALSGISNEELVSRMQSYEAMAARFPQLISPESYRIPDTTIRLPEGIVSALGQPTLDLSPLREDLRSVAEALARQKQLTVSIDKNGFVLSETGTQSTTTYHQNLMNR